MRDDALKMTLTAFENSKAREKELLRDYQDPLAKTIGCISKAQEDWRAKEDLREQLRRKYVFDNPTASEQKTDAAVFRLLYETKVKERKDDIEAQAMRTDFRATLSQTQLGRIGVRSSHSGVWQSFKERVGPVLE